MNLNFSFVLCVILKLSQALLHNLEVITANLENDACFTAFLWSSWKLFFCKILRSTTLKRKKTDCILENRFLIIEEIIFLVNLRVNIFLLYACRMLCSSKNKETMRLTVRECSKTAQTMYVNSKQHKEKAKQTININIFI